MIEKWKKEIPLEKNIIQNTDTDIDTINIYISHVQYEHILDLEDGMCCNRCVGI